MPHRNRAFCCAGPFRPAEETARAEGNGGCIVVVLRVFCAPDAVIIIVFFVPYTASGFAACGKLFHSLFGVDYMAAMLVSALVIVGYTILGGFRAVTTTDLIQSIVMSLALIAVLVYGVGVAGGWDAVVANAQSLPAFLTSLVVCVVVSLVTPAPSAEIEAEFEAAK